MSTNRDGALLENLFQLLYLLLRGKNSPITIEYRVLLAKV